jgi:hypothetical protein
MLSVADNLSRALDAVPQELREDEKLKGLVAGIEATAREIDKVFALHGISRIAAKGLPLDPNQHQAMLEVPSSDAEPGTVLAAGSPVLRLAHDGPRDAVFSVPEDRVLALRALMGRAGLLQLRLWGADDEPVPATVREVSAAADPATRTYLVKADVGSAPVRLGQTATVLINAPTSSAIKLPLHAVFGKGQQSTVWLVDRNTMTVRQQPITLGGADGNLIVVSQGLAPGDVVVTAGVHTLTPGQKVRWYNEPVPLTPGAASAPAAEAAPSGPAASAAAPSRSAASAASR